MPEVHFLGVEFRAFRKDFMGKGPFWTRRCSALENPTGIETLSMASCQMGDANGCSALENPTGIETPGDS
jgi:hypothetical protein